jgi:hypothetical protein
MSRTGVDVPIAEILSVISNLKALKCERQLCPGFGVTHTEGTTCLRCESMIRANSWLPLNLQQPEIARFMDHCFKCGQDIDPQEIGADGKCPNCGHDDDSEDPESQANLAEI